MNTITFTEEHMKQGASRRGAWSRIQLAHLGVSWPPKSGWRKRLIGSQVSVDDLRKFIESKNGHIDNKGQANRRVIAKKEYTEIAKLKGF